MQELRNKRIFYIEDDLNNRAIVQTILEQIGIGFEFERWGNIPQVLQKINLFQPDLILLDLMFPKNVSGYDIFDALKNNALTQHIPIVAVSASDPSIEIPKARARGFNGFISKPIHFATFQSQIAKIFEGIPIWA